MGKVLKYILIFLFLLTGESLYSQVTSNNEVQKYEMDVEDFLGMFDGIFSDALIDEISYNLPDELTIVNYGIGNFSGSGYLDLGISYKDRTCPPKTFKVILLVNIENRTFKKVLEFYAKWKDTPFDVGFSVRNHTMNITYRKDKYWVFSSYAYQNDNLNQIREEMY